MFGIDDAAIAAIATVIGSTISGSMSGSSDKKTSKRNAKTAKETAKISAMEERRRTIADLLNKAYGREVDVYKANQDSQNNLRSRQALALQDVASGFRQSLLGR